MCKIFLEGGKSASFPFIRRFRQSNRTSKQSGKESEFQRGGGSNYFGVQRVSGGRAFWTFQGKEGLKCSFWPMVGYGYFLESPNN